ncbi:MAG: hypothetical protein HKN01_01580 [Acidimicrobiia bacterium]|nr:hypothetical protein [Acidimicrobiia bacterium]
MTERIEAAAILLADKALEHPDVYASTPHPPDDNLDSHFFIQDFRIDDNNPLWGDFLDVTFSLRFAAKYRIAEESWALGYRILDPDTGLKTVLEELKTETSGPFEELQVTGGGMTVVLNQQDNTRYLAIDMVAGALLRSIT